MKEISVDLDERSYPIRIGRGMLTSFGEVCKSFELPQRAVVVTDSNVGRLYLRSVVNSLKHAGFAVESIVIPHGEQQKSLRRANSIITRLLYLGLGKSTTLVALGGGVIGDLTGFVAATYGRGVPFVQVPTTLLAQAESSIGGKVGVNHPRAKNAIGTFHQPKFVFTDIELLRTIPKREIVSGLGEVIKYGIVVGEVMMHFLESHLDAIQRLDLDAVEETILRCATFKASLVSRDERETESEGGRVVLNVGHASGQTMEAFSNYRLRHGEAVLLGLRMETFLAKQIGLLDAPSYTRIASILDRVGFDMPYIRVRKTLKPPFRPERLIKNLLHARFILPDQIGRVVARTCIPEDLLKKAFESIC